VLTDSEETYYRREGHVLPMRKVDLGAESPVGDNEDLDTDQMNVDTFKKKRSPEKGADFELNTDADLMNAFDQAVEVLRKELMITRELVAWQGLDGTEGMIGSDGQTANSDLDSDNVITPGTAYSDHANASPQDDFISAEEEIDTNGTDLNELPAITAYIPPSVEADLKQNDDLESRFSGVQVQRLSMEQIADVIPFDNIETVYTKEVRTNDAGQPFDGSDNVVDDRKNAVLDNVLEPYDNSNSTVRRNIVIGTAGDPGAAGMPVLTGRLENVVSRSGQDPLGDFSVDNSMGFVTQSWFDPDPSVTWFKVAQEIGFELVRPENWVIIQDI